MTHAASHAERGIARAVGELAAFAADRLEATAAAIAPTATQGGAATLRIVNGRVQRASVAARRLFGAAARRKEDVSVLAEALEETSREASDSIRNLIARGESFSSIVSLDGGVYRLRGAVHGAAAMLEFVEIGDLDARLHTLQQAAELISAERDALRAALPALGGRAWRFDRAGALAWSTDPESAPAAEAARAPLPDGGALLTALASMRDGRGADEQGELLWNSFTDLRIGLAAFSAERRLSGANRAFAHILGLADADLYRRPGLRDLLERLRESRMMPEQADFQAWRTELFALFEKPATAIYDERWEMPDRRVLHVIARPFAGGGVYFIVEDVSPVIEMERWRNAALKSRRLTLDAMLDGVIEFGPDGAVRATNNAFLRLWRLDGLDAQPTHVSEFAGACAQLAPDPPVWDIVCDAVSGHGADTLRSRRIRLSDRRVLEARIAKMPDGKTLAAFTDVTDSERISDALRERAAFLEAADAMRASALYEISHGLRTPISAVVGFADLLAGATDSAESSARYVANIRDAAASLRDGVDRLAELVAAGSPSMDKVSRSVSVTPMLHSAAALLERRLRERGARFDFSLSPAMATVRGDPARVRQLIFSMLSEAIERAPCDALLSIEAQMNGETLEISCSAPDLDVTSPVANAFAMSQASASMHGAELELATVAEGCGSVICRVSGAIEA